VDISAITHLDPDLIEDALHKISDAILLETPAPKSAIPATRSRRALLRKAGVAGATIVSVSAPAAVAAQSTTCLPLRTECTPAESNPCCALGVCDTRVGTGLIGCCLPNGVETSITGDCCSGTSRLVEVGSSSRICIARGG
jgi:hypothetical protein